MNSRTNKGLRRELTGMRWPAAWLLCVIVYAGASGCRRESPPPEPTRAEQPAEQPAPDAATDSSPDIAPRNTRPSDASRPPASAKVTIVSVEPIPEGEFNRPTLVEGGIVSSISDEPAANAAPTAPRRLPVDKGKLRINPVTEIEQELVSKWEAIQSLASKLETYFHSKSKDFETRTEGMGTRDCLKKDGKMLVRSIFGNSIRIEIEDEDPPVRWTGQRTVKVFDGEYLYTQISTYEGTKATKRVATASSFMAVGGPGLIAVLRGVREMQRQPDAMVDGRSMYVLTGSKPADVRVEYMIDKETGLLHSVNREWRGRDRTRRFKFVDHVVNPGFPEDHFTFTPAEGVEVEDRTRAAAAPPGTDPQP